MIDTQHHHNGPRPSMGGGGPGSMSPVETSGQKRRVSPTDDSGPRQQRAKRKKYVGNACTQCHRRHIKCNGQQPCERCSKMRLDCEYVGTGGADFRETDEFQQMQSAIQALQNMTSTLQSQISAMSSPYSSAPSGPQLEAAPPRSTSYPNPLASPYERPGSNPSSNPVPSSSTFGLNRTPSLPPLPKHAQFQGPTSFQYNFDRAKNTLQAMGITSREENAEDDTGTPDLVDTPEPMDGRATTANGNAGVHDDTTLGRTVSSGHKSTTSGTMHPDKDPLWYLGADEAMRLIHVWQDEMGEMYPVLDFEELVSYTRNLYAFIESAARSGLMQATRPGSDGISDEKAMVLKGVFAISLTLEGGGHSELGDRMFENVRTVSDDLIHRAASLRGITLMVLTAMYHFHHDNEGLAWRILGLAARMTMELGLHQSSTYVLYQDDRERATAIRLFWSIYVLDRRWSFGTGRSFALQDADIDPTLPKPSSKDYYLASMVDYALLSSKVWRSVANLDASRNSINEDDMRYFDYKIMEWHRNLPPALKFDPDQVSNPSSPGGGNKAHSLGKHRRRVVQYLRRNQMRVLIHRPVLHTATSIAEHMSIANLVVEVAKDTIRTLTQTDRTTDVYRTQPVMFNYFLVSALAVLFLAVSHAPASFSDTCKDEFYQAVELVRGLSAESFVGKRLWKTVRELKEVGPKLGLHGRTADHQQHQPPSNDGTPGGPHRFAHQDAALTMAGLATGHRSDSTQSATSNPAWRPPPDPPVPRSAPGPHAVQAHHLGAVDGSSNSSPNGVANDLTSLFEAAGGSTYAPAHMLPMSSSGAPGSHPAYDAGMGVELGEDELAKILGDLF